MTGREPREGRELCACLVAISAIQKWSPGSLTFQLRAQDNSRQGGDYVSAICRRYCDRFHCHCDRRHHSEPHTWSEVREDLSHHHSLVLRAARVGSLGLADTFGMDAETIATLGSASGTLRGIDGGFRPEPAFPVSRRTSVDASACNSGAGHDVVLLLDVDAGARGLPMAGRHNLHITTCPGNALSCVAIFLGSGPALQLFPQDGDETMQKGGEP